MGGPRHPFRDQLALFRARKPGLTQTRLAELAGYDHAILVRMCQGKKDLTGPSGRARVVRLIETLADQGALSTAADANALLLAANLSPLFDRQPEEGRLLGRLAPGRVAVGPVRSNLPAPLTSFVGRVRDMADAMRLLSGARLLTLTGAGGCGKTRLAGEIAARAGADYPDGVLYIELAPLIDAQALVDSIAQMFGLAGGDADRAARLEAYLRDKHILLVLDNCEHILDGVARFASRALRACPRLTILATSREPINMDGETVWRVSRLSPVEADQLFEARAKAACPGIEIEVGTQLVMRLDGIPLAIEIAAARLSAMTLDDLSAHLAGLGNLIGLGRRDNLPHHQTLRALTGWSYALLNSAEQRVFRRLSIFVDGWTAELAREAVWDDPLAPDDALAKAGPLADAELTRILMSLVAKGLVEKFVNGRRSRFRFLETVKEFGLEMLEANGEPGEMKRRHALALEAFLWRSEAGLRSVEFTRWIGDVEAEFANIAAAMQWSLEAGNAPELGCGILAAAWGYLDDAALYENYARRWRALAANCPPEKLPAKVRAYLAMYGPMIETLSLDQMITAHQVALDWSLKAQEPLLITFNKAQLARFMLKRDSRSSAGQQLLDEAVRETEAVRNDWLTNSVTGARARIALTRMDFAGAEAINREGVARAKRMKNLGQLCVALHIQGICQMNQLRFADARASFVDSGGVAADGNYDFATSFSRPYAALATNYVGDREGALAQIDAALAAARPGMAPVALIPALSTRCRILIDLGLSGPARDQLDGLLRLIQENCGSQQGWYCSALDLAACVASATEPGRGARLFGAADAAYQIAGRDILRGEYDYLGVLNGRRPLYTEHGNVPFVTKARAAIGEGAFAAAHAEGRLLALADAIGLVEAPICPPTVSG